MATRTDTGGAAAVGAAWLCLAAAPTFALRALLTAVLGGGPQDILCQAAPASPLSGMVPMYVLMSVFHAAPWLKLVCCRRSGARLWAHPMDDAAAPPDAHDMALNARIQCK